MNQNQYLVSAIVSTYNSEVFIKGCLDDLQGQTIADNLQIIVIDSCSQQREKELVEEYQKHYNNIVYFRTSERESLYKAWNRGISLAVGKYLTNTNTDDRHRIDSFERMVEVLENHPEVALVYADQLYTPIPNETFDGTISYKRRVWPEYSYQVLRSHCMISSQPMWRRSLHDRYGVFDETFESAGDWDFWLRVGRREKFKKIDEVLGLYYENPNGIENSCSKSKLEIKHIREVNDIKDEECNQSSFRNYYLTPVHKALADRDVQLAELDLKVKYLEHRLSQNTMELELCRQQSATYQHDIAQLKDELHFNTQANIALQQSLSWKITAPLRFLHSMLPKLPH